MEDCLQLLKKDFKIELEDMSMVMMPIMLMFIDQEK